MTSLDTIKKVAINLAIEEASKAILLPKHTTQVGAAIYTIDNTAYGGFNIQNYSHKSYHAEEMAVLCCQLSSVDPKTCIGIVITFSKNNLADLTFACGHCRQLIWEYCMNPNFLVTEVDMKGNIIAEKKLSELYPMPYPYPSMEKLSRLKK